MTLQNNVSKNRIAHRPGDQGAWSTIRHKVETKKPQLVQNQYFKNLKRYSDSEHAMFLL